MEISPYMEAMVANRAQPLSEEEYLAGEGMLSIETQRGFNEDSFYSYYCEYFSDWLKMVRILPWRAAGDAPKLPTCLTRND